MKIVFISDTHTKHRQLAMPKADVLVHCGDFTYQGNFKEVASFNNWLGELDYKYKLVVAGNHELGFDNMSMTQKREMLSNAQYLEDESITINNINFYFSPFQPWFNDWSFNFPRNTHDYEISAKKEWNKIPDNTNVLITHGPPYGILDKVNRPRQWEDPHVGCKYLLERIKQLKDLKIHAFGHIHEGYGIQNMQDVNFINVAVLDDEYNMSNQPVVMEV